MVGELVWPLVVSIKFARFFTTSLKSQHFFGDHPSCFAHDFKTIVCYDKRILHGVSFHDSPAGRILTSFARSPSL